MADKELYKTCGTNFIPRFTTKMFQLVKMPLNLGIWNIDTYNI